MKNLFSITFIFLTISILYAKETRAQNGSLSGVVIDQTTGETLPGVSVVIEGTTKGVVTDFDGKYSLTQIAPGTYRIVFSMVSYNKKIVGEVAISSGKSQTLNASMELSSKDIGEVVIEAEARRESLTALLIQQKNAVSVSDGVSAESIKRTPDRNTSDVLKRVSGASIQDNKFAIVRGLNDRYNLAMINGAPLPSSESDRKAFAFDIFPANMLDNMMIIKTATPDMPAEFGGGIIQINTREIPDENFVSFQAGAGFNFMTTGREQLTYQGGKNDWIGMDDGTRELPDGFPSRLDFPTTPLSQAQLAKQYPVNNWGINAQKFLPNQSYQFALGRKFRKAEKDVFGLIVAANYNRNNQYLETDRQTFASNVDQSIESQLESRYFDRSYSEQTLAGLMLNLSAKLAPGHSLSFKNLYSINSDDRVILREGTPTPLDPNPVLLRSTAQWFTGNNIYSGQFSGDHSLAKSRFKLNWVAGYSNIERSIPNLKRSIYTKLQDISDPAFPNERDTMYMANISSNNVGPDYGGGMFFAKNRENILSGRVDLQYVFPAKSDLRTSVKTGANWQQRSRDFGSRQIGYTRYTTRGYVFADSLLWLNPSEIFSSANMGTIDSLQTGFRLKDGTKLSDSYQASSTLQAAYIMADHKYKEILRFIYGVRTENFNQKLNAVLDNKDTLQINTSKLDVLPSANLILSLSEKQNLRLCYSRTLNRPEFRELAPFAFYDFNTQFVYSGNDSLQRAQIDNYDIRYEVYPGRGQVFSVTGFYKSFLNPIEQISRPDVSGEVSYKNVASATNYGAEVEFRVVLGSASWFSENKFLNNLTLYSNVSLIRSQVDVASVVGSASDTRPLQGQSPYIFNAGLLYQDFENGLNFSAAINRVGQRIAIVGNVNEPDIWENGRTVLDLQVGKTLLDNKLDLKLSFRDALAQKLFFYQDINGNGALELDSDDIIWASRFAPTLSFAASYRF